MSTLEADVQDGVDQAADALALANEAREMGWKPKEEWKGSTERWVDAETYLRRGKEFLPILQHTTKKQREELDVLRRQLADQERINRANTMALNELQETSREATVATTTRTLEDITSAIAAAREAGDVAEEERLRDERYEARATLAKAKEKPAERTVAQPAADPTQTPEFQAWIGENSWFKDNAAMRGAAISIQTELTQRGTITAQMPMAERLAIVGRETKKAFNYGSNERRTGASRVEGGGGNSAGGGGGADHGKTYADLPPEAKAACDKAARKLSIGEGRKFKDEAAWRKSYVDTYYS